MGSSRGIRGSDHRERNGIDDGGASPGERGQAVALAPLRGSTEYLHARLQRLNIPLAQSARLSVFSTRRVAQTSKTPIDIQDLQRPGCMVRLGQLQTTPIPPKYLQDNGSSHFLSERWLQMHGNGENHTDLVQATRVANQMPELLHKLRLSTYLHHSLDDTLEELGYQMAIQLEALGAEFTEAEFLYVATEVLEQFCHAEHTSERDKARIVNRPELALENALYPYRKHMQLLYHAHAKQAQNELVGSSSSNRDRIVKSHFPAGDRDLFRHHLLQLEATQLNHDTQTLIREMQEAFEKQHSEALERLSVGFRSIDGFNRDVEHMKRRLISSNEYGSRMADLQKERRQIRRDALKLWPEVKTENDSRREVYLETYRNNSALDEAIIPKTTEAYMKTVRYRLSYENEELDLHKRYQELHWLVIEPRTFNDSSPALEEQRLQKVLAERKVFQYVDREVFEERIDELFKEDIANHYQAFRYAEHVARIRLEPNSFSHIQIRKIIRGLEQLSARKAVDAHVREGFEGAGVISKEEAEELLQLYGEGETFLAALEENPDFRADLHDYFTLSVGRSRKQVDLGPHLDAAFQRQQTSARAIVIEKLLSETRRYALQRAEALAQLNNTSGQDESMLEQLTTLNSHFKTRRATLMSYLGTPRYLETVLNKIIDCPEDALTANKELQAFRSGDLAIATAAELRYLFSQADPIAEMQAFSAGVADKLHPEELERAFAALYGEQALTTHLNACSPQDRMLAHSFLRGKAMPDALMVDRVIAKTRAFTQHQQQGLTAEILETIEEEYSQFLEANRQLIITHPTLLRQAENAVSNHTALRAQVKKFSTEYALREAMGDETFSLLAREVDIHTRLSKELPLELRTYQQQRFEKAVHELIARTPDGGADSIEQLRHAVLRTPWLMKELNSYCEQHLHANEFSSIQNLFAMLDEEIHAPAMRLSQALKSLANRLHPDYEALETAEKYQEIALQRAVAEPARRLELYNRYESVLIAQRNRTQSSIADPSKAKLPQIAIPEGLANDATSEALQLTQLAAPIVAEIMQHARDYGALLPFSSTQENDPWVQEFQTLAQADFQRKVDPLFSQLAELDSLSSAHIDLRRVQQLAEQTLRRSGAQLWLAQHPNSSWKERDLAGLTDALGAQDIATATTLQEAKPLCDKIVAIETRWAKRIVEAGGNETLLASLALEKAQEVDPILTELYRSLRAATRNSSELSVDTFRNRVAKLVEQTKDSHTVLRAIDALLENTVDPNILLPQIAKIDDVDGLLNEKQVRNYIAQKKLSACLKKFETTNRELGIALGAASSLETQWGRDGALFNLLPEEEAQLHALAYQQFRQEVVTLAEYYPEEVDIEHVLEAQERALRRTQVLSWLENNCERHWSELQTELSDHGGFNFLPPAVAKQIVRNARLRDVINELGQLHFQYGAFQLPAVKYNIQGMKVKFDEVCKRIELLEEKLAEGSADMPELHDPTHFARSFTIQRQKGLENFLAYQAEHTAQKRAEEQQKEADKVWSDRAGEILVHASKQGPKVLESCVNLTFGNLVQAGGFVEGAVTLRNPFETARDRGTQFLVGNQSVMNDYVWGGSALGRPEQLAAMGDWELAMRLNPLNHASASLVDPGFELLELTYDETAREIYNSAYATSCTYEQFLEIQKNDPTLKWCKRGYHSVEIGGSIALMFHTGGSSLSSNSARTIRAMKALGVSTGFSVTTAIGQELLNPEDFALERFFDNSLEGTSHSMIFMSSLSGMSQLYVRGRYGKPLPANLDELTKLKVSAPADFARLQQLMQEAQMFGRAVDVVDAQGDLADSLCLLDTVNNWEQLLGAGLLIGVSTADCFDWHGTGGADHLRTSIVNNGERQSLEVNGIETSVLLSRDGRALYVESAEAVRELYATRRTLELQIDEAETSLSSEQRTERARQDSETVVAYYDTVSGQMVLPGVDSASNQERELIAAALQQLYNPSNDRAGKWLELATSLNEAGYDLDLKGVTPAIRRIESGDPSPTLLQDIETYLYRTNSIRNALLRLVEEKHDFSTSEERSQALRDFDRLLHLFRLEIYKMWQEGGANWRTTYAEVFDSYIDAICDQASNFLRTGGVAHRILTEDSSPPVTFIQILPQNDGHALNRYAYRLKKSKGVELRYCPELLFRLNAGAAYSPDGKILIASHEMIRTLSTDNQMYHEKIHAVFDHLRDQGADSLFFGEMNAVDNAKPMWDPAEFYSYHMPLDELVTYSEGIHLFARQLYLIRNGDNQARTELIRSIAFDAELLNRLASNTRHLLEVEILPALRNDETVQTHTEVIQDATTEPISVTRGTLTAGNIELSLHLGRLEVVSEENKSALLRTKVEQLIETCKEIATATMPLAVALDTHEQLNTNKEALEDFIRKAFLLRRAVSPHYILREGLQRDSGSSERDIANTIRRQQSASHRKAELESSGRVQSLNDPLMQTGASPLWNELVAENWTPGLNFSNMIGQSQILLLSDTHHGDLGIQKGLGEHLAELRAAGVTHLAYEFPSDNDPKDIDGIANQTRLPHRTAILLREARAQGIELVLIDKPDSEILATNAQARSIERGVYMGEQLAKLIEANPEAKVAAIVGYAHVVDATQIPLQLHNAKIEYTAMGIASEGQREPGGHYQMAVPQAVAKHHAPGERLGYLDLRGEGLPVSGVIHFPRPKPGETSVLPTMLPGHGERVDVNQLIINPNPVGDGLIDPSRICNPLYIDFSQTEAGVDPDVQNWEQSNEQKIIECVRNLDGLPKGQQFYLAMLLKAYLNNGGTEGYAPDGSIVEISYVPDADYPYFEITMVDTFHKAYNPKVDYGAFQIQLEVGVQQLMDQFGLPEWGRVSPEALARVTISNNPERPQSYLDFCSLVLSALQSPDHIMHSGDKLDIYNQPMNGRSSPHSHRGYQRFQDAQVLGSLTIDDFELNPVEARLLDVGKALDQVERVLSGKIYNSDSNESFVPTVNALRDGPFAARMTPEAQAIISATQLLQALNLRFSGPNRFSKKFTRTALDARRQLRFISPLELHGTKTHHGLLAELDEDIAQLQAVVTVLERSLRQFPTIGVRSTGGDWVGQDQPRANADETIADALKNAKDQLASIRAARSDIDSLVGQYTEESSRLRLASNVHENTNLLPKSTENANALSLLDPRLQDNLIVPQQPSYDVADISNRPLVSTSSADLNALNNWVERAPAWNYRSEWGTEPKFNQESGTMVIPIERSELASTGNRVRVKGKVFQVKPETHLTVVGFATGRLIKEAMEADPDFAGKLQTLISTTNWNCEMQESLLHLSQDLLLHPTGSDATPVHSESVIQLAEMDGLPLFYAQLEKLLAESLERELALAMPFPHVTLYTHGQHQGIDVPDASHLQTLQPREVDTLRSGGLFSFFQSDRSVSESEKLSHRAIDLALTIEQFTEYRANAKYSKSYYTLRLRLLRLQQRSVEARIAGLSTDAQSAAYTESIQQSLSRAGAVAKVYHASTGPAQIALLERAETCLAHARKARAMLERLSEGEIDETLDVPESVEQLLDAYK